jgi:hypothetical protein
VVDVNGDGSPDVVIGSSFYTSPGFPIEWEPGAPSTVAVLLNEGGDKGTLTLDPTSLVYGQNGISILATVSETVPGSGTPTGNVSLALNGSSLGQIALAETQAGTASGGTTFSQVLSAGTYTFLGTYPGDGNFNPTSFGATEIIAKAATSVTFSATPLSLVAGQKVALSATVVPQYAGVPTGRVTFNNGGSAIGSAALNSAAAGNASIALNSAGNDSLTAVYGGDGNFVPATSAAVAVTVTDFSLSATPAALTLAAGQSSATSTVTVNAINGFSGAVNVTCSAPSALHCSVTNGTVNAGQSTAITISPVTATASARTMRPWIALAILCPAFLFMKRRRGVALMCAMLFVAAASSLAGCGGSGASTTNLLPYTVTLQGQLATDATIIRSTSVTVTVETIIE